MKLNRMHVVLSAELSTLTAEQNEDRTEELLQYLESLGMEFDRAEGCYKGVKEASFVVQLSTFQEVPMLMETAQGYGQESILLVDARDKGYIIPLDGAELVPIGKMQTSSFEPTSEYVDAYTKLGGVYYFTYNFDTEK